MTDSLSDNFDHIFEDFAALLEQDKNRIQQGKPGDIVSGYVLRRDKEFLYVDVKLKSEGKIPLKQFEGEEVPEDGSTVDVYLQSIEGPKGEIVLSRERARREAIWTELQGYFENAKDVMCKVIQRVKGGFRVDINGAPAFLPGSQVDIRPVRDPDALIDLEENMRILKFDRVPDQSRVNVVVSRRVVLEEDREVQRKEL
ncbi:MAG: S1 RNA-binding domain-containing protein, partial [Alphaproteobacteria bacterium]|nr:S1 RNA-binding domain-containing protein [Alphaproteobacteria bacterium]